MVIPVWFLILRQRGIPGISSISEGWRTPFSLLFLIWAGLSQEPGPAPSILPCGRRCLMHRVMEPSQVPPSSSGFRFARQRVYMCFWHLRKKKGKNMPIHLLDHKRENYTNLMLKNENGRAGSTFCWRHLPLQTRMSEAIRGRAAQKIVQVTPIKVPGNKIFKKHWNTTSVFPPLGMTKISYEYGRICFPLWSCVAWGIFIHIYSGNFTSQRSWELSPVLFLKSSPAVLLTTNCMSFPRE